MAENFLLQGTVKWSYDHELAEVSQTRKIMTGMASFTPPLHHHEGYIALTSTEIIIESDNDEDLSIPLSTVNQVYLGFDDLFPMVSVRGAGLFWQPLRIGYSLSSFETQYIYVIINFNGIYTHDKEWFNTLTAMFQ
ncbi:MAG: hypothetical protein JWR38_4458 [Mucilaginibacter sp.]|nr:hypothetical protein [Mucilaginibacter sp.]